MTTVLIVDDQALQRLGFSMLMEQHPDLTVVGEATHGAEAVRMTAELHPDVVLMDVRMPGMDGIEATRRIVSSGGRSRVLVMTTFDLDEYAYDALRAGASGFLLKDALPEELLAGVRAVAAGDDVISPGLTRKLIDAFTTPRSPPAAATPRSPNTCTWPRPPSSPTSAASLPRSAPGTASRRSSSPTTWGLYGRHEQPARYGFTKPERGPRSPDPALRERRRTE